MIDQVFYSSLFDVMLQTCSQISLFVACIAMTVNESVGVRLMNNVRAKSIYSNQKYNIINIL